MPENSKVQTGGTRQQLRDMDFKIDKLTEQVTRLEVLFSGTRELSQSDEDRMRTNEKAISEFAKEHQYVRGQLRMLMILGGALVGLAIIIEMVIMIIK